MGNPNLDVDFSNPETQRGLAQLQVVDDLTGQLDRHGENIFVDRDSGKVTAIDHDMAFGKKQLDEVSHTGTHKLEGLPMLMDDDMAMSVLSMSPDQLEELLTAKKGDYGKLDGEERGLAGERLARLQDHVFNRWPEITVAWSASGARTRSRAPPRRPSRTGTTTSATPPTTSRGGTTSWARRARRTDRDGSKLR